MVLIDSTAPASATTPRAASPGTPGSSDVLGRVSALVSTSARFGLGRLYGLLAAGGLPSQSQAEVDASTATAGNLRSTIDEYVQATASMEEAASLDDLADKPLAVLTAGSGSDAAHMASQNELATLSTNSVHRVIEGAAHEALVADQDAAASTTQGILDVVSSVRSGGPLAE